MGREPSEIRAEIEETRERVGEDVDALSYKTDVKGRASDYVSEKKEAVVSKVTGVKDAVSSGVSGAVPDGQQMKQRGRRLKGIAEGNPLGLALAGVGAGFVVGTLFPSTRVENERFGELSDRMTDAAKETGQEAVERAKTVAQETAQSAQQAAQHETGELASSLQERAQQGTPST
jgi:Protein of unknown function (DUF3618)